MEDALNLFDRSVNLAPDKLMCFFVDHLNKIYFAKKELVDRLPKIAAHAHFLDLQQAITETVEEVQKQIIRINSIYSIVQAEKSFEQCDGLNGLLGDAFTAIEMYSSEPELRDMAILFYMQNIESLEMSSFRIMQIAAQKLDNPEIKQLLLESYDEAKSDRALYLLITSKYIKSN